MYNVPYTFSLRIHREQQQASASFHILPICTHTGCPKNGGRKSLKMSAPLSFSRTRPVSSRYTCKDENVDCMHTHHTAQESNAHCSAHPSNKRCIFFPIASLVCFAQMPSLHVVVPYIAFAPSSLERESFPNAAYLFEASHGITAAIMFPCPPLGDGIHRVCVEPNKLSL